MEPGLGFQMPPLRSAISWMIWYPLRDSSANTARIAARTSPRLAFGGRCWCPPEAHGGPNAPANGPQFPAGGDEPDDRQPVIIANQSSSLRSPAQREPAMTTVPTAHR